GAQQRLSGLLEHTGKRIRVELDPQLASFGAADAAHEILRGLECPGDRLALQVHLAAGQALQHDDHGVAHCVVTALALLRGHLYLIEVIQHGSWGMGRCQYGGAQHKRAKALLEAHQNSIWYGHEAHTLNKHRSAGNRSRSKWWSG